MNNKTIGIIGGMGPEATLTFYKKIIENTKINVEQDHFHVIIDSNAKIPDRTTSILNQSDEPLVYLKESLRRLESLNVDVIAIPCITAHYFYERLNESSSIKIVSAIEAVDEKLQSLGIKKVGLLSTKGTIKTKIFEKVNAQILYPNEQSQDDVMDAIYGKNGIKTIGESEYSYNILNRVSKELIKDGAEAIILGCTELGIALNHNNTDYQIIDSLEQLAIKTIKSVPDEK